LVVLPLLLVVVVVADDCPVIGVVRFVVSVAVTVIGGMFFKFSLMEL
jgi:hypothetical protein